ncbi:MAG: hypothetical protein FWC79_02880 [Oscillospiraceae bacterium]|nr:hypothetical protein [Oscillospiraceae bacterium]
MEKQRTSKGVIALIVILILLVIGLAGFIVYDRFIADTEEQVEQIDNQEQREEENEEENEDLYNNNNQSTDLDELSIVGEWVMIGLEIDGEPNHYFSQGEIETRAELIISADYVYERRGSDEGFRMVCSRRRNH